MQKKIVTVIGATTALLLPLSSANAQVRLPAVSNSKTECDIHLSVQVGRTVTVYREVEGSCFLKLQDDGDYVAAFTLQYEDADGTTQTVPGTYYYDSKAGADDTHIRISGLGFWKWGSGSV